MIKTLSTSGLVLALALPAVAQNRDSDGDVISVIDYTSLKNVYYTLSTDPDIKFRFGIISPVQGGDVLPERVLISGTVHRVEKTGNNVFPLPQGSNQRVRANLCKRPASG